MSSDPPGDTVGAVPKPPSLDTARGGEATPSPVAEPWQWEQSHRGPWPWQRPTSSSQTPGCLFKGNSHQRVSRSTWGRQQRCPGVTPRS